MITLACHLSFHTNKLGSTCEPAVIVSTLPCTGTMAVEKESISSAAALLTHPTIKEDGVCVCVCVCVYMNSESSMTQYPVSLPKQAGSCGYNI